jgi:hypothetical protein
MHFNPAQHLPALSPAEIAQAQMTLAPGPSKLLAFLVALEHREGAKAHAAAWLAAKLGVSLRTIFYWLKAIGPYLAASADEYVKTNAAPRQRAKVRVIRRISKQLYGVLKKARADVFARRYASRCIGNRTNTNVASLIRAKMALEMAGVQPHDAVWILKKLA